LSNIIIYYSFVNKQVSIKHKEELKMFKVEFDKKYVEFDSYREAVATYVYYKLLGVSNVRYLELIEEDDEGWEHWRIIKHPISHYKINLEEEVNK
jgi:hypothetical protein